MRSFFSYVIAMCIIIAACALIPVERFFHYIMDTGSIEQTVRQSGLYGKLIQQATRNVTQHRQFKKLESTALALSTEEIQRLISKTFAEDWFYTSLRTAHLDLINPLNAEPSQNDHVGYVIITDKKDLLLENLVQIIENKMDALPECSPRQILAMAGQYMRNNGKITLDKIKLDCKPPQSLASEVRAIIRQEVSQGLTALPDTIYYLQWMDEKNSKMQHKDFIEAGTTMRNVRLGSIILLFAGMLILVVINFNNKKQLLVRTALPLILTGLLLGGGVWFGIRYFEDPTHAEIFKIEGPAAINKQPMSTDTANIILGVVKTFFLDYMRSIFYTCLVIGGIGLMMLVSSRYVHDEHTETGAS